MKENNIITGFNRIEELIEKESGKIQKIIINRNKPLNQRIIKLINKAKSNNINIQRVEDRYFKRNKLHNEILCAEISPFSFNEEELLKKELSDKEFIIAIDGINDPHNLGAIIRTAYFMGVKDIIVPKKRVSPLSQVVFSSSAGAIAYIKPYRVKSIPGFLKYAKDKGFTVICADAHGDKELKGYKSKGKTVLLFGSEGAGISSEPRKLCDIRYHIKSQTGFESLNLSNSVAIFLYKMLYESDL
jgi:23S rRNA (guanosine2251-2'-O)-methyltransferase